jgi:hypothetical protein
MAVTQTHGGFQVELDTTMLSGITAYNLGTGTVSANETNSGNVYPEYPFLRGQKPVGSITTVQIARALDNCGLTGTSIAGLAAGLKFYLNKHADGSTRTAGAAHNKYTMTKGLIVPTSLTCDHQGDATLSFDVVIAYDGSNDPIVLAINQSLPAGQLDDQRFTLGPVTLESVLLTQVQQFTITFGVEAVSEGADSDLWDQYSHIRTIKPSLSLTGSDPNWLAAAKVPLTGLKVTHANTKIYLRKWAIGSTFVANGTAQHIKFTAEGLATIDSALDVSGDDSSSTTLTMPLHYDGTNAPLVINTASAIT